MATGSAGGLAALSGRSAGTTPLHDFYRENLPEGQDALTTKQGAEPSCAFGAALLQGLTNGAKPEQGGRFDIVEADHGKFVRYSHPEPVSGREHADRLGI